MAAIACTTASEVVAGTTGASTVEVIVGSGAGVVELVVGSGAGTGMLELEIEVVEGGGGRIEDEEAVTGTAASLGV